MGEQNRILTETLWKVALGVKEELPADLQTPTAMKEFFNAPCLPNPILALVFDRMIKQKGDEFLMDLEYAEVLKALMDRAEETFCVLQGRLSRIEKSDRLALAYRTANRNIPHILTDGYEPVIYEDITSDLMDILCTDKMWDKIIWLVNGRLINKNRISAALILLYISPWLPANPVKYLKIMSIGSGLLDYFFANIIFCPQKLSGFLSTHNFYEIATIQIQTVLDTLDIYLGVLITKDRLQALTFQVDIVPAIWRLLHYDGQKSSVFYEALLVMSRDVPALRDLCKKQFGRGSYATIKDKTDVQKLYSEACMKILVDKDYTTEELLDDMPSFISIVNMATNIPVVVETADKSTFSHSLFRAKAFACMVTEHDDSLTTRYPAAILMILMGIEDLVPRKVWIQAAHALSERDIRRIPTMDLSDPAKALVYARLGVFQLTNTEGESLLPAILSMATYEACQPKEEEE